MKIKKSTVDSVNISNLSKKKVAFFSLFPATIFFITLEVVLRVGGFYFSTTPLYIGIPEIVTKANNSDGFQKLNGFNGRFRKDKWLLWTLESKSEGVNLEGFRGKEISIKKPRNILRIACMGDSCTMVGQIPYPDYVESMLKERIRGIDIEVINAGCGSYSSLQGLRSLDKKVRKYKPDYISIFFGWNDHWLSLWKEDKDIEVSSDYVIALKNLMNHSRVYQFAVMHVLSFKDILNSDGMLVYPLQTRVSIKDYEENLNKMVDICKEIRATPILITAPTVLHANSEALRIFCDNGFLLDPNQFNQVHDRYNDIVKKVAIKKKAILLDLASIMDHQRNKDKYFLKDGIHFTRQGRIFIAQLISDIILMNN